MYFLPQLLEPERVAGYVVGIVKSFVDDHVHHRKRQGSIRTGIDRQIPVCTFCGARAIGIDYYQLGAGAARFIYKRPEMAVVAVNVRRPGDDVARISELLGLSAELGAQHGLNTFLSCRGANGAQ